MVMKREKKNEKRIRENKALQKNQEWGLEDNF